MPCFGSTATDRSDESTSVVDGASLAISAARLPKVTSPTRSQSRFAPTNEAAAAEASESATPAIERERSSASATLLHLPSDWASTPKTGRPFSRTTGGFADGALVTTLRRVVG